MCLPTICSLEVPDVISEFNVFERRFASPLGDTKAAKPVHPVPEALAKGGSLCR